LNLKDKTSLKPFARYHAIDIHIKFCVWKQLKRNFKPEVALQNHPFLEKSTEICAVL
jgi:hypothetical protein